MPMEENLRQFYNESDGFAVPVIINGITLSGIARKTSVSALKTEGYRPSVLCPSEDLPSLILHGDSATVKGLGFFVIGIEPDGTGQTLLQLEENATPNTKMVSISGPAVVSAGFLDQEYIVQPNWEYDPPGYQGRVGDEARIRGAGEEEGYDAHAILTIYRIFGDGNQIPADAVISEAEIWVTAKGTAYGTAPAWIAYPVLKDAEAMGEPLPILPNGTPTPGSSWKVYKYEGPGPLIPPYQWDTWGCLNGARDYDFGNPIGSGNGLPAGRSIILSGAALITFLNLLKPEDATRKSIIFHNSEEGGPVEFYATGEKRPYLRIKYTET
ncbi:MAG: hypothetical protein KJ970_13200 [Candidatus Eisenbacteria bacterium]|uniref:Uncharacterized protein n=1 Tax=Eiseniibacteriota bacterium TaxID=2212470 RepID=A0A948W7P9_UNCEI|nr:hypothetical protein [Candidatus Eisenbacteria bacterium]MBU1949962.1 hypothetical protein [Candidatus Eisenbacteria bacterium]MBU2691871.1 hypothetical protein [Candidatus Eisenbacteria bacterium]